jgi:hypothetical protein
MVNANGLGGSEKPETSTAAQDGLPQIFRVGDEPVKVFITLACPTRSTFVKMIEVFDLGIPLILGPGWKGYSYGKQSRCPNRRPLER